MHGGKPLETEAYYQLISICSFTKDLALLSSSGGFLASEILDGGGGRNVGGGCGLEMVNTDESLHESRRRVGKLYCSSCIRKGRLR